MSDFVIPSGVDVAIASALYMEDNVVLTKGSMLLVCRSLDINIEE